MYRFLNKRTEQFDQFQKNSKCRKSCIKSNFPVIFKRSCTKLNFFQAKREFTFKQTTMFLMLQNSNHTLKIYFLYLVSAFLVQYPKLPFPIAVVIFLVLFWYENLFWLQFQFQLKGNFSFSISISFSLIPKSFLVLVLVLVHGVANLLVLVLVLV